MSVEHARNLILKIASDEAFREQVASASPAEKKALLAAAGFSDVTREDVAAANPNRVGELSDADLEAVAGGDWLDVFAAIGDAAVQAASAAAAAASA
jgi:predicted ribosomally synthesized peptide with nif11-like leader